MLLDIFDQIREYAFLYAPLGIIGVWRWSVWLIQKFFSLYYRPYPSDEGSAYTYSVITPVYNENPEVFRVALDSWKSNGPDEIIAVMDASDKACIEVFQEFSRGFSGARLIVTDIPGKRPALVQGIMEATSDVVALVDSDTVWDKDVSKNALAPFANGRIGGVGTRQAVLEPKTLAERLFAIRLNLRYLHEFPFLMTTGNVTTCLSGRTAFYRRRAVLPLLEDLLTEKFWGKPCISGDDKRLTSLLQAAGWHTQFQQSAVVWTPGMPKLGKFFLQNLRWARNSWRTDLRVIFSFWPWRREPVFAYHLIDRTVQPFTLLLGPIFLVISLTLGHWGVAAVIFAWWMISRTIKLYPHLKSNPRDLTIVPFFTFAQYYLAILKIYALFTMNFQGWITRWDSDRLKKWTYLQLLPSRLATFSLIGFMAFTVAQRQYTVADEQAIRIEANTPAYTEDFSDFNLAEQSDDFWVKREAATTAAYITRTTDTPFLVQKRFNLSTQAAARSIPQYPSNLLLGAGRKISIPVEELKNALSVAPVQLVGKPFVSYNSATNTITLKGRGSVMTIPFIHRILSGAGFTNPLQETSPGEWMLRSNLYAGDGVTLIIDGQEVRSLRMKSDEDGFVFLQTYNASLLIKDTKITSWNEKLGAPDLDYKDGRAYVLAKRSGRMDVLNSDIGYLGYARFTKINERVVNGGGIYGLSWKINNNTFESDLLTGSAIGNKIHDNYFGMYTYGATGMEIRNNEVFDNVQYGIDPHDDSNNLLIENNFVHDNGNHGIIVSKRVVYSTIRNNVSTNNALHGLMLDRQSNYNLVENNVVSGNNNGIAIYDSHSNLIRGNDFIQNRFGIRANMNSSKNMLQNNSIRNNERGVFIYGGAEGNILASNVIKENSQGIYFKQAAGNVVLDTLSWRDNGKNIDFDDSSTKANFVRQPENPWWVIERK